jgi:RNA polymerase sigma factor (sigma-70 family)
MVGKEEPLHVDEEEWKSYYVLKEIAEDALHNPHHEREQSELLVVILRYVEGLPEHYRRTVRLKLEGLTDDEVAKELKLPVGTIKSHYSRAKQILRDRLKGDGYL